MKKSLKFLAGVLAAVTLLSSAAAVAVSAKSPVYTDQTVPLAQNGNVITFPGINTEFFYKFDDCLKEGFVNCHKHHCWWWNNIYCYYKDFSGLTKVEFEIPKDVVEDGKYVKTYKPTAPWAAVRRVTNLADDTQIKYPGPATGTTDGVIHSSCLLPGGKYYPSNMVDLNKFFKKHNFEITMNKGQVQLMNANYKMYSASTNVVRVYNDGTNQVMEAVGEGSAYVYFYTNGGVPFLRLTVNVKDAGKPTTSTIPVVDIRPAQWSLSKVGDSTSVSVYATEAFSKDIELKVVYGSATINENVVIAKSTGPIILRAYSASNPAVCGYAVLYVGQYTSSIVDGSWKPTQNGICGNIWNPNLWCEDGYTVCGWIEVNGIYIPVIKKCEKPETILPPTGVIPSKIFTLRELIALCRGDLELVLDVIEAYKENGFSYYDEKYTQIIKDILKDSVLGYYYLAQLA